MEGGIDSVGEGGLMEEYIPKQQLEHGHYYRGTCRNASVARWNGHEEAFYYHRTKFGLRFVECISAPEDDWYHDVFLAQEDITDTLVETIPF